LANDHQSLLGCDPERHTIENLFVSEAQSNIAEFDKVRSIARDAGLGTSQGRVHLPKWVSRNLFVLRRSGKALPLNFRPFLVTFTFEREIGARWTAIVSFAEKIPCTFMKKVCGADHAALCLTC
jgi:hypothetical protein